MTTTREKVKDAYAHDPDRYDHVRLEEPRGRMLSAYDQRLFRSLLPEPKADLRVLEVGSGTGRFTIEALQHGLRPLATDVNEPMLERLRARVAELGFDEDACLTQVQDVFNLTLEPASFDFVYSIHVIPRFLTVEDQTAALRSIAGVVRPGGTFLFNYRNRRSPYNALYKGPAATPRQIEGALAEGGMRITRRRGKWLLNKTLLKRLPMPACRAMAAADRAMLGFWPDRAWDVFAVATKDS